MGLRGSLPHGRLTSARAVDTGLGIIFDLDLPAVKVPPAAKSSAGPPPVSGAPAEDALVAKFVRAWESADLDALVALLTDDVFMSMPPMPFEYEGRDVVARFCAGLFGAGRRFDLVPTRANGQPAFGAYLRAPGGIRHGTGLYVLTLAGDRICAMTRFDNSVLVPCRFN
jgi:hypothetical protein